MRKNKLKIRTKIKKSRYSVRNHKCGICFRIMYDDNEFSFYYLNGKESVPVHDDCYFLPDSLESCVVCERPISWYTTERLEYEGRADGRAFFHEDCYNVKRAECFICNKPLTCFDTDEIWWDEGDPVHRICYDVVNSLVNSRSRDLECRICWERIRPNETYKIDPDGNTIHPDCDYWR